MTLPDPRLFSSVQPKNMLVQQVNALLAEPEKRQFHQDSLHFLMEDRLRREADDDLGAAMSLAPTPEAYKVLWQTLGGILAGPIEGQANSAIVFAIPLIIVAGVKGKLTLPSRLKDTDAIKAVLAQHGVIQANADVFLSSRLVNADGLSVLRPSQLYRWKQNLQYASGGLPIELEESPMELDGEAVFLRFIVGVAMQPASGEPAIRLGGSVGAWGMPLTHLLGEQLGHEAVTMFVIPRTPNLVTESLQQGRFGRQEIQMQVVISNTLRKIRTAGETPVAIIAAHQGGELRLTLSAKENPANWAGFVWPLTPLDNIDLIEHNFCQLMNECHVDDVRVIDQLQVARHLDLPFYLTADEPLRPVSAN